MPVLQVNNASIEIDDEGFLTNYQDWNPQVAQALAEREGITALTDEHLSVLYIIRSYYEKFHVPPMVHLLSRECKKNYRELYTLFHKQPGKRAAKLAGLPKATGCV